MPERTFHTLSMHQLVERIQVGDDLASDELIRRVAARLERLARKMLQSFSAVKRWEQTDDILQNALIRFLRSLSKLKPANTRAFFGLATEEIRRELLDLHRHYQGARGLGKNIAQGKPNAPNESTAPVHDAIDSALDNDKLERWHAFHEAIFHLPAEEREVFGLVYYHNWTQPQIAALLNINERTVRRYWQSACLQLHDQLKGALPID